MRRTGRPAAASALYARNLLTFLTTFWDKEAKRGDGSWDYEQVEKSAHALCPHCGYKGQGGGFT